MPQIFCDDAPEKRYTNGLPPTNVEYYGVSPYGFAPSTCTPTVSKLYGFNPGLAKAHLPSLSEHKP